MLYYHEDRILFTEWSKGFFLNRNKTKVRDVERVNASDRRMFINTYRKNANFKILIQIFIIMLTETNNLMKYVLLTVHYEICKSEGSLLIHSFLQESARRICHEHALLMLLSDSSSLFPLTLTRKEKADMYI